MSNPPHPPLPTYLASLAISDTSINPNYQVQHFDILEVATLLPIDMLTTIEKYHWTKGVDKVHNFP